MKTDLEYSELYDELMEARRQSASLRKNLKREEQKLDAAKSALKVLRAWASYNGGSELITEHVLALCDKTLKKTVP